jgi:hypothetical protein
VVEPKVNNAEEDRSDRGVNNKTQGMGERDGEGKIPVKGGE